MQEIKTMVKPDGKMTTQTGDFYWVKADYAKINAPAGITVRGFSAEGISNN